MSGVRSHAPINHIYVYKKNIVENKTIIFCIKCGLVCVDLLMKTCTCPVGLDFSGGSAYEDPMDHTPNSNSKMQYHVIYAHP